MDLTPSNIGKDRKHLVRNEQLRIAFRQTPNGVFGTSTVGLLFAWVFWPVADHPILIGWLVCLLTAAALRAAVYVAYLRRAANAATERSRRIFVATTFLQASVWGAAWWLFLPVEGQPVYTMVATAWMIGMSAASISGYTVYIPALLAFFMPVIAPGVVLLFVLGGSMNIAVALGLGVYIIVTMNAMLPIHKAMVDSIRLNFENAREIRERKQSESSLREISIRDSLTGLATRRHFDEVLQSELRRAQRRSAPISLVLVDIDFFKALNDNQGHVEGDTCLRRVAERVKAAAKRPSDLAARYGGEEFAVILPDTNMDDAYRLAENMRQSIQALGVPHRATKVEKCAVVTVSAGVATITPSAGTRADDLIRPADEALYLAKRNGRNRVEPEFEAIRGAIG